MKRQEEHRRQADCGQGAGGTNARPAIHLQAVNTSEVETSALKKKTRAEFEDVPFWAPGMYLKASRR